MHMYRAVKSNSRISRRFWTSRCVVVMTVVTSTLLGLAFAFVLPERDHLLDETDHLLDETELVFALMVLRHGDRTPEAWMLPATENSSPHYGDLKTINALIEPWGHGQLTNNGIRTSYKTGQFIRRRYQHLLPAKYNHSEVYIRSTDVTRTKMSVLSAMAAVFPPVGDSWSQDIHWVPVPYSTVEPKYDFMLSYPSCAYWVKRVHEIMALPAKMSPYEEIIEKMANILDYQNLTRTPLRMYYVNDVYTSLIGLGLDVGDDVRALMPDITAAAAKGWDVLMEHDTMVQLEAGVLLHEFFNHANRVISGKPTEKIRIYSGHDINMYCLETATLVPRQGIPKYGSLYSLELRRMVKTGQYFVLPVYLSDPHEGVEKYLEVRGCGVLCDYNTFYNLTKKYLIDEPGWRKKCGVT